MGGDIKSVLHSAEYLEYLRVQVREDSYFLGLLQAEQEQVVMFTNPPSGVVGAAVAQPRALLLMSAEVASATV